MKEFINYMADPIRSFPIVCVLFVLMMKYYRVIGTKKFAWISVLLLTPVYLWFMADPNFFAIILWPDNIPISILIFLIAFLTWYALYRCATNDARLEAGEGPIEGTPENREKVWFGREVSKTRNNDY